METPDAKPQRRLFAVVRRRDGYVVALHEESSDAVRLLTQRFQVGEQYDIHEAEARITVGVRWPRPK